MVQSFNEGIQRYKLSDAYTVGTLKQLISNSSRRFRRRIRIFQICIAACSLCHVEDIKRVRVLAGRIATRVRVRGLSGAQFPTSDGNCDFIGGVVDAFFLRSRFSSVG